MKIFYLVVGIVLLFALFHQAKPALYPYLVRICSLHSGTKCNGILVTQQKVLTSARCLSGISDAALYFGYSTKLCNETTLTEGGLRVNSSSFRIHEKFIDKFNTSINDLAIIRLPVAARIINNQTQVANISNVPLDSYYQRTIVTDVISPNHSVYNDSFFIEHEEVCNGYLTQDFHANQHGCATTRNLLCKLCRYDSNGFPLELDGMVFGMITRYSPLKPKVIKFTYFLNYNAWIYSKSTRVFVGNCAALAMMLIVQLL